jgi:hypothetical protein
VHDAVEGFAQDFGYDLDEEGQPLDDDDTPPAPRAQSADSHEEREAEQSEREETTAAA